ncbi:MAG: agmatinase [Acidobacteriia bacterium]|nr:agmatinase [Terriglobia bacterium]
MGEGRGEIPPFGGEEARSSFDGARVVVLPVPYEGTVSWGSGTSRGPEAILRASTQVELYDEQTCTEPFRAGIFTDPMLPIPDGPTEKVVDAVASRVGELMAAGKWVVMLGGEHSITPGAVCAAAARNPGLHLVQLDAHADLRESYEGKPWSHASAMARCLDLAPIRAVGIRNYSIEEAERIRAGIPGYAVVHAWEMERDGWQARVLNGLDGKPVYLTIDLDYFDPSVIPATGTPEPGGGAWWPTLRFLYELFRRARVVACDLVELAPAPGLHHADFTAARLAYKVMGMAFPPESGAAGR